MEQGEAPRRLPLPVAHPEVYAAVIDEPNLDFIMVMEDLAARGCDPRDSTRPLTADQAASGLRGLARLRSAFWGGRFDDHPGLGWVQPFVAWQNMGHGIPRALRKAGDTIAPEVRALTREKLVEDLWTRYIGTLAHGPRTLLHGDPHIGNTYVLPGGGVGFLDRQVLRRGNWSLDVGYFLQGALTVEDRRASEADLLEEYRNALDVPSGERPTRDDAWLRYRASAAHGLAVWLATFSHDAWQRDEVCLALVQRYAAAYLDFDTPAAIDALT
ncbi:phosphotransferase [Actinocorallia populi]|uniref:phosphotransferase n=1 Tax=Actinocorallia populi TaxID=2079200 RepID=UPI000D087F31|nr:phosphotransferase [Actinocorallia populi]